MNHIETLRAEISEYFDPQNLVEDSLSTDYSPNKEFRIQKSRYRQTTPDLNWHVTKVEIFENVTGEKLFDFLANDTFFHAWLNIDETLFLVGAEDMFGGQSVIDLTNRRMESYSPGVDGFIWTEFFLSPDGKSLATIGCVWASPYEIRVYDFRDPMTLPLPELKAVTLKGTETIVGWLNNVSLQTEGVDEEVEEEEGPDGNLTWRALGTRRIGRIIRIDE